MEFFKYHSLGNDFILIDAMTNPKLRSIFNKNNVQSVCHRHFGIGADGVLIISQSKKDRPVQCEILNSDGSKAELCINGIRCIAQYLFTKHQFPDRFILEMGQRSLACQVVKCATSSFNVILNTSKAESYNKKAITLPNKKLITGDAIKFSNPHFVIFKVVNDEQLHREGEIISTHQCFPQQTNVAYVFKKGTQQNSYSVLFYERGAGVTLSCGSGASAVMWALYQHKKVDLESKVTLHMQGGKMLCLIDKDYNIIQEASAQLVFQGQYL